jgi:hypothetical protein
MAVPKVVGGKPLTLLIAVIVALTAASSAYATTFDSAHEPPVIGNPGVTTRTQSAGGPFASFQVTLALALICPAGQPMAYTVTFEDATGSRSIPLQEPCNGEWPEVPFSETGRDFDVSVQSGARVIPEIKYEGSNPSALIGYLDIRPARTTPFIYQVTGPSGVVAQAPMTATVTPPEEINQNTEIDRFINTCIDGSHELKSKEGGNLYCEVGGSVAYTPGGWPAPPVEAPAATEPTSSTPAPKQTTTASIYRAFRANGSSAIRTRTRSGYCWSGSATVNRRDAWRCMTANQIEDPCFSATITAKTVICPVAPWDQTGIKIRLTRPLPRKYADHAPPSLRTQPWALELYDGKRATFEEGASNVAEGHRLNYFFGPSSKEGLWGYPSRSAQPWTILAAPFGAHTLSVRVAIRRAWM